MAKTLSSMEILQEKPSKEWIISIHGVPEGVLPPAPKRSLVFTPKHHSVPPVITPVTPESITQKQVEIRKAVEEGNTNELLRNTNNNIMGGLQENLKNMAAIATMSHAQWKRVMALVIVYGLFNLSGLVLQAITASRSCT
jgi:hypothetical protein